MTTAVSTAVQRVQDSLRSLTLRTAARCCASTTRGCETGFPHWTGLPRSTFTAPETNRIHRSCRGRYRGRIRYASLVLIEHADLKPLFSHRSADGAVVSSATHLAVTLVSFWAGSVSDTEPIVADFGVGHVLHCVVLEHSPDLRLVRILIRTAVSISTCHEQLRSMYAAQDACHYTIVRPGGERTPSSR